MTHAALAGHTAQLADISDTLHSPRGAIHRPPGSDAGWPSSSPMHVSGHALRGGGPEAAAAARRRGGGAAAPPTGGGLGRGFTAAQRRRHRTEVQQFAQQVTLVKEHLAHVLDKPRHHSQMH
eukprot:COSAG01_NODE_337_length_18678_cov_21.905969_2_plen_122_part_00